MTSETFHLSDAARRAIETAPLVGDANPVEATTGYVIDTRDLNLWYGTFQALYDINLKIKEGMITSLIGPSGCGKTTFLRSINRINERLGYVRTEGRIEVIGKNIYAENVDIVQLHASGQGDRARGNHKAVRQAVQGRDRGLYRRTLRLTRTTSMKFPSKAVCFFLFAVIPLAASADLTPLIRIKGSDTMVHVAQTWAEEYQHEMRDVAVSVGGGGSGTGFHAMLIGTADLVNASRRIAAKELERAQSLGMEPVEHIVGFDALAVYCD